MSLRTLVQKCRYESLQTALATIVPYEDGSVIIMRFGIAFIFLFWTLI